MNDHDLLQDYALKRNEEAFGQLVERHLAMVYSAARRMVRDDQRAQDVAQNVFATLAQKAATIKPPQAVGGWLYKTTRHLAMHASRTEQRRHEREQAAAIMQSLDASSHPEQFIEHLEPAMAELEADERDLLVLRYLENRSLREVGAELGISEDAARMRVNRALERLRSVFAARGTSLAPSLLASALVSSTGSAVPAGLATTITAAALAGTAAATVAATPSAATAVSWLEAKAITAIVSAGVIVGTGIYLTQRLRRDQLPVDSGNLTTQTETAANNGRFLVEAQKKMDELGLFGRENMPGGSETLEAAVDFEWRLVFLGSNAPPRLPRAEVENYLDRKGRDAASLLAAYHASDDTNYLEEAATKFPDDPKVQWTVLTSEKFPEERRRWLELFKASSPDNSLANYLSAKDYLNGHHTGGLSEARRVFGSNELPAKDYLATAQAQAAIGELLKATRKPSFVDYLMESRQDEEALHLAAGRSPIQSKLAARGWVAELSPHLATLKSIGYDLEQLQKEYLNTGDIASAVHLAQMGLVLADRLRGGDCGKLTVSQLTAAGFEALVIQAWEPNGNCDFLDGKTPKSRLEELRQQRDDLKSLSLVAKSLCPELSEAEVLAYLNWKWQYGDVQAVRWLQQQKGAPQP
jgi:RNA polymerase sigma factor (sigma-70 family)